MKKKRQRQNIGPFIAMPKAIWEAPAWRAMTPEARLLWIDMRGQLRNDGLNNGKVYRGHRTAGRAIGLSKNTVTNRFAELEHYGFLRITTSGFLGIDGRGIAAKYRFTDLAHGTQPATRDYEKWDGELFVYTSKRVRHKKQIPVTRHGTPCPTAWDVRKGSEQGAVCPTAWDIDEAVKCPTAWDISRLPSPAASQAPIQGSSTVRAPAQAGGAGSSPAPVASNSPTGLVLEMVAKLSPEVRMLALGLQP
jgi:hypothetical protein